MSLFNTESRYRAPSSFIPGAFQPAARSASPTFLGIDHVCREIILGMILQNKLMHWHDECIDPNVQPISLAIPWVGDNNGNASSAYKISKARIHIGNVNVLRVSHQLCFEGKNILYGENSFVSYNFPQLKYRLPVVIGRQNMKLIQKVTIGLPMKHKRDPAPFLGGFLEFFKEKLPNLRELTMTTHFLRSERRLDRHFTNTRFGEEVRAMLNTSAWITCRHHQLKKAVWLVESGGQISPPPRFWLEDDDDYPLLETVGIDDDSNDTEYAGENSHEDYHDADLYHPATSESSATLDGTEATSVETAVNEMNDEPPAEGGEDETGGFDQDRVQECRLTVKILACDRRFRIREQTRIDMLPVITQVVGRDIILDCRAIRRIDWDALYGADPRSFALHESAVSSEPPIPLIHRTQRHGGIMYADYQSAMDYLRDRFKYMSLKDKTRVTGEAKPRV